MKKRTFILMFLFSISLTTFSQSKLDFESIKKNISNPESEFFYTKILTKYNLGDTTMTMAEMSHCYYGHIFSPNFKPYERPKGTDLVDTLINKSKNNIDSLRISRILDSTANKHPFDLKTLIYQRKYSTSRLSSQTAWNKIYLIAKAIQSSGNGLTKKTPMYIIDVADEFIILKFLGLSKNGKQSLTKNKIDEIGVQKNNMKIKKLYFDLYALNTNGSSLGVLTHQFYHMYLNYYRRQFIF